MAQVQYSDMFTESQLQKLQRRIVEVYKEAYSDIETKAAQFFASFEKRYEKEYKAFLEGKYTQDQFDRWCITQIARGKKWDAFKEEIAEDIFSVNEIAAAYINDTTPTIYSLNHNYELFRIEQDVPSVSFNVVNEQAVRKLIGTNNLPLLPNLQVKKNKDTEWNAKKIQNAILQGIIQGESIGKMASRLENVVGMNRNNAIRNARTAVNCAQNMGKQAAYEQAAKNGLPMEKQWVCTLDDSTRDLHRELDGQKVDIDDDFKVQGYTIRFPGDNTAAPELVYNCRCTMKRLIKGVDYGPRKRWTADRNPDGTHKYTDAETYREWINNKKQSMAMEEHIEWLPRGQKISRDEYKGLMAYANENGIRLNGFKSYDGEISLIKSVIDDCKQVVDICPILTKGNKPLTIKLDLSMNNLDFAATYDNVVHLNSNAFRNTKKLAEEYQKAVDEKLFVQGTDYHSIIKHECGHVYANKQNIDSMEIAKEILQMETRTEVQDWVADNLSRYAGQYDDGSEIISECFSSVFGSSKTNGFALNFIRKCGIIL